MVLVCGGGKKRCFLSDGIDSVAVVVELDESCWLVEEDELVSEGSKVPVSETGWNSSVYM